MNMSRKKLFSILGVTFAVIAFAFVLSALILNLSNWSGYVWVLIALPVIGMFFIILAGIMIILINMARKDEENEKK
jgi:hypothetical protein